MAMTDSDRVVFKQAVIHKAKMALMSTFHPSILEDSKIEVGAMIGELLAEQAIENIRMTLKMPCGVEEYTEEVEDCVYEPKNWFQGLKAALGLSHYMKQIPVKVTRNVSIRRICPHSVLPATDQLHVRWMCEQRKELP